MTSCENCSQPGGAPSAALEVAGLAAQIILENGAETYRVEDTVLRILKSYGYDRADVIAFSTGVIISLTIDGRCESTIRRVRKRTLNLTRINDVNALSRRICGERVSAEESLALLSSIAASQATPLPWVACQAGISAGFFSLMFGGSFLSCAVAVLCGAAAQILGSKLQKATLSLVLVNLAGGLLCSLITMAAFYVLGLSHAEVETALTGAIMPLISGLMMTNAVRDSLRGDLLSGIARGMEALLVAILVALGISFILRFYLPAEIGVQIQPPEWYLSTVYAGFATLFFCSLLSVPRKAVIPASLLGAAAYAGYLLLRDFIGADDLLALFLASTLTALLCEHLARSMRMVATIFLCIALVPLVPGLGLYRTMHSLLLTNHSQALALGAKTLLSVGAIALGAAIGSILIARRERRTERLPEAGK